MTAHVGDWTSLGGYRLVQTLGEGGMGVVHLALDRTGRAVALKVLRPHIGHDPVMRSRLEREVETLGRIRHPGVAPVLDADLDGERPFIVTRYVPGPPLEDVVRDAGPLRGADLLRFGRGLALALRAIHEAGVVHRDVKPANVLLLDGDPVLIDFGIAHIVDDVRLTSTGLVMGTPGYLSPEIVDGAEVSDATDWWGWAATVAYAAIGRPPFGSGPMDAVLHRVSAGQADLEGVDPRLAPLLAAALSPDPDLRPDVDEVLAGLERYAAGDYATQPVPTEALPALRTRVLPQAVPATEVVAPVPRPVGADHVDVPVPGASADPRIGRPNRSGVLAAGLAVLVAGAAVAPYVAVAVATVWAILARAADRSVTSLVLRRHANGVRRSDLPVAVLSSPWHLLVGIVATAFGLLLPAVVAVGTAFCAALGITAATADSVPATHAVPLAVGAAFGALVAWWGPFGAGLRRGTRSLVRGVTGPPVAAQVLTAVLLLAAGACAAYAVSRSGVPLWWPEQAAPAGVGR